jgi:MoxR-like ATPase
MAGQPHDPGTETGPADLKDVERLMAACDRIRGELAKVIVGQTPVIEQLLVALLCRGHCILEGVPGLAKTLLISTLARTMQLRFSRIQFTPDLMPTDITGTEVIEEDKQSGARRLRFVQGPVFANMILADEVNRTPPKTQAALLEAMQEHQVTAAGQTHKLPEPFFVLATQNPIEQEGTYPLPEAQLDRFLFKILVTYPDPGEELAIVKLTAAPEEPQIVPVIAADDVLALQASARVVPCADPVARYALGLVRATRPEGDAAEPFVREYVSWGAGPRASQHLVMAGRARAILRGRFHVSTDDIQAVARPGLRHRIITNFNAEASGVRPDDIVERLIEAIPAEPDEALDRGSAAKVFATGPAQPGGRD